MRANFVVSGVATGIRRNLSMTVALVLSTAIALAFVGAAILANTEISRFQTAYEGSLNVSVFLCPKPPNSPPCTGRTTQAQTDDLRQSLQSDPLVESVQYVSELEQYKRGQEIIPEAARKLTKVGDLPASFTVKLKDIKKDYNQFAQKYETRPGVSRVQNAIATIRKILDVIDGMRLFAILIAAVVLIASVLLISNTIQVAAAQRKNETSIMRLVGASRWMTELPFVLETLVATIIGALIAAGLVVLGKYYVFGSIFPHQVESGVIPDLTANDIILATAGGLAAGIVLSGLTAFVTLRLYVKL
jgi:cell division transport system permease protein